jgi:hypothetical protein
LELSRIFEKPDSAWESQLRDIFRAAPEVTDEPLFQLLSLVFHYDKNTQDIQDVYRLLGMEDFCRIIHLLDGRVIKFPTSTELKDAVLTALCYYYHEVQKLDWQAIHDKIPFAFNSISISRRVRSLDNQFKKQIIEILGGNNEK